MALRCLLVDDNVEFLEAAKDLLEREGVEVVGLAKTGAEAIASAAELRPDVTLVDLYLGRESGFELVRRLTERSWPERPAVILISTYSERDLGDLVAATPAMGFLSKRELSGDAIRSALERSTDH